MKIFVTVGTHEQQFNRLLKEIDNLLEKKRIRTLVFAQTGSSDFKPKNFEHKKFLSPEEMQTHIAIADIIISHAGAGSIIEALEKKKPLIVVPRLKKFGEHTNDHQKDLALAMQKAGKLIAVLDIGSMEKAIIKAQKFKPKKSSGPAQIIRTIEKFLTEASA